MTRLMVCWMFCLLALSPCSADTLELVGVSSTGEVANGDCTGITVSADGRFVAFTSDATNLAQHETSYGRDGYVRDRFEGLTYCVSVTPTGGAANSSSTVRGMSNDGRYVVFRSAASNLVSQETGSDGDLFVRDMSAGSTELVSVRPDGTLWPKWIFFMHMSGDGRYVYLYHWEGEGGGLYLRDREAGTTELLWRPGHGFWMDISDDGRYWAFEAEADGIVPGDTNGVGDVFLWDRELDTIEWVSVSTTGGGGNGMSGSPRMSGDGRLVAFRSQADNLVSGDSNGLQDTFLYDRALGSTQRVNVGAEGQEANAHTYSPQLSRDGRYVLFMSEADNLVPDAPAGLTHTYIWDREADVLELASIGDCEPTSAMLSLDGRYLVFASMVTSLTPLTAAPSTGVLNAYLRDRAEFDDIPMGHWAHYAIEACVEAGIVAGYPDGFYRPDRQVTRDQMAVFISRALAGASVPAGPEEPTFPDVAADHWAYKFIEYAATSNIVEGYPNGYYRPEYDVSRAQMSVFIARSIVTPTGEAGLADYGPPETPSFGDVPTDYWCYSHIEYLAEEDVVGGYPDGLYRPTMTVTRDQMAVYVARGFGLE